jgi:hypothetical protein
MSPAAGMGLCTEDDNGQRHDDCWRRISMRYDPARGIMRVEDYYDYRVER